MDAGLGCACALRPSARQPPPTVLFCRVESSRDTVLNRTNASPSKSQPNSTPAPPRALDHQNRASELGLGNLLHLAGTACPILSLSQAEVGGAAKRVIMFDVIWSIGAADRSCFNWTRYKTPLVFLSDIVLVLPYPKTERLYHVV